MVETSTMIRKGRGRPSKTGTPMGTQTLRVQECHKDFMKEIAQAIRKPGMMEYIQALLQPVSDNFGVGPFKNQDSAINYLRSVIVDIAKPKAVYLFGSRARGDNRPDSDFDILVVVHDGERVDTKALHKAFTYVGIAVDLVVCDENSFENEQHDRNTIVGQAYSLNKRLYLESVSQRLRRLRRMERIYNEPYSSLGTYNNSETGPERCERVVA